MSLAALRACAGPWTGTNQLFFPPEPPRESASELGVASVIGGKFVRIDYTWAFEGAPQEGSLLIGFEGGQFTIVWGDTWHMGDKLMLSTGAAGADTTIDVFGTYAVEGYPDWGWRTVLRAEAADRLQLQMYNVSPEGESTLAVDAGYSRA
jgi:hypothetical protein